MIRRLGLGLAALLLSGAGTLATGAGQDDYDGLPPGPGREAVGDICTVCHSLAIVTQQRLSRKVWDEVLVWMVEEQGMGELEPELRRVILDYLTASFAVDTPR